jgi:hypothetical protein
MMRRSRLPMLVFAALLGGCAGAPPAAAPRTAKKEPAPPPPVTQPPPPDSETCGTIPCRRFDTPQAAFAAVLATKPLVLAIGETHAQQGTEAVPSATKRFTEQLLPMLQGRASDLVLELLVASGKCGTREAEVAEEQKPVTETQAKSDQNEFVTLGNQSNALGIRPHVLEPSCEQYDAILAAGDETISRMLETIAQITTVMVKAILLRNQRQGVEKLVLTYGGIVHNDRVPRAGRETWSFGPEISAIVGDRYVEVDLIVPEYIKDEPPWTSLPWVAQFDRTVHADQTRLLEPSPGSFVLVFPSSR